MSNSSVADVLFQARSTRATGWAVCWAQGKQARFAFRDGDLADFELQFGFQGTIQGLWTSGKIDGSTVDALWARNEAGISDEVVLQEIGVSSLDEWNERALASIRRVSEQAERASFEWGNVTASARLPGVRAVRAAFEPHTRDEEPPYFRFISDASLEPWLLTAEERVLLEQFVHFESSGACTPAERVLLEVLTRSGAVEQIPAAEWRRREEEARMRAEQERLRKEEEERLRREEEARLKREEEERLRREEEERLRREEEERQRLEEEERRRIEAERLRREEEERLRREEEERVRAEQERLRLEEEARLRREEEERLRREEEERQRIEAERLRLEEEARVRAEQERLRLEEEERLRREEEERLRLEEEARLRREEEERLRLEAEERARAEQERLRIEEEERLRREEEERLRLEEEARLRRDEEERQRREEEERARREAEERARREEEERLRLEEEARLRRDEEERLRREAEERARLEEEERQRAEAERLKLEEEERLRRESEERARLEEEARLRAEEDRRLEEERLRREAEERARLEEEERQRAEAERLRLEEEERLHREAEERALLEEEERQRAEAERLRLEEEERQRAEAERLRLEEEERQRAEAERLRLEEEERQRAEAERLRLEEEERQRAEAERLRLEEEERQRAEAERLRLEEEERQRREEEERLRKLEEEFRAEQEQLRLEEEARHRREEEERLLAEQERQRQEETLRREDEARVRAEQERLNLEAQERQRLEEEEEIAREEARRRKELEERARKEQERQRTIEAETQRLKEQEEAWQREEEALLQKAAAAKKRAESNLFRNVPTPLPMQEALGGGVSATDRNLAEQHKKQQDLLRQMNEALKQSMPSSSAPTPAPFSIEFSEEEKTSPILPVMKAAPAPMQPPAAPPAPSAPAKPLVFGGDAGNSDDGDLWQLMQPPTAEVTSPGVSSFEEALKRVDSSLEALVGEVPTSAEPPLIEAEVVSSDSATTQAIPAPAPSPSAPPSNDAEAEARARRQRLLKKAMESLGAAQPARTDSSPSGLTPQPSPPGAPRASPSGISSGSGIRVPPSSPSGIVLSDAQLSAQIEQRFEQLKKRDHFTTLGVTKQATKDQVKAAYLSLAKIFHPDRLPPTLPQLAQKMSSVFEGIRDAYETLYNDQKRTAYERTVANTIVENKPKPGQSSGDLIKAADAYFKKRDYRLAEDTYAKAHAIDKGADSLAAQAWAIFMDPTRKNEAGNAKAMMNKALGINQNCDRAHYQLGVIARVEGDIDRAERHFREAVRVNPKHLEANQELRLIDMRKKKATETPPKKGGFFG